MVARVVHYIFVDQRRFVSSVSRKANDAHLIHNLHRDICNWCITYVMDKPSLQFLDIYSAVLLLVHGVRSSIRRLLSISFTPDSESYRR